MDNKTLAFNVDVVGVSAEAQELAKLEVAIKKLRSEKLLLQKESLKEGVTSEDNARKLAALNGQLNTSIARQKALKQAITPTESSFAKLGKTILAAAGVFTGITVAVRAFFNVIKNGFKTSFEFEYAMSQVKAISRATGDEFQQLSQLAINLGASTKFTASEVAALEKEYAKLGFTTTEILHITSATLDLAAATGSDLANSAAIAGATLRQFQLDATQMQRVVDVMTLSFSSSALDMEKFTTAMQHAGPVAASVGETIESTSAKLSVLANNGLDASISGTSLRNIFLELQKRGLTWDEAMNRILTSQNKGATSLELFGKRGATAGIILAQNGATLDELTKSYQNADGSAKAMAATMLDNVKGSAVILKSAWEGLILRTNESNGAIKNFIDTLTLMVSAINTKGKPALDSLFETQKIETFGDRWKVFAKSGVGFWGTLAGALTQSNDTVQQLVDDVVKANQDTKAAQDEIDAVRIDAEQKARQQHEDELKRIQESVDAAEEAAQAKKEYTESYMRWYQSHLDYEIEQEAAAAKAKVEQEAAAAKAKEDINEQYWDAIGKAGEDAAKEEWDKLKKQEDAKIKLTEESEKQKFEILDASSNLIHNLAGKNKTLQKGAIVADKAITIAEIIMQTRKANAATRAWGALGGPVAMAIAAGLILKNNIIAGIDIAATAAAAAAGVGAFAKGGKINRGVKVTPRGKDDTLILANKSETVLTADHVARLGGSGTMRRIGVPGYANGGYIGQSVPDIPSQGFDMRALAGMINAIEVRLDINKVNASQNELAIINTTQKI